MLTDTGVRFWSERYGHGLQNLARRIDGNRVVLALEHPNVLQVRKVNNRMIVFNGTHRSFELIRTGHRVAPALVIEHQHPAEVPWMQGPMYWNPQLLVEARHVA